MEETKERTQRVVAHLSTYLCWDKLHFLPTMYFFRATPPYSSFVYPAAELGDGPEKASPARPVPTAPFRDLIRSLPSLFMKPHKSPPGYLTKTKSRKKGSIVIITMAWSTRKKFAEETCLAALDTSKQTTKAHSYELPLNSL